MVYPLQYSGLENFMNYRGCKELDLTERMNNNSNNSFLLWDRVPKGVMKSTQGLQFHFLLFVALEDQQWRQCDVRVTA